MILPNHIAGVREHPHDMGYLKLVFRTRKEKGEKKELKALGGFSRENKARVITPPNIEIKDIKETNAVTL